MIKLMGARHYWTPWLMNRERLLDAKRWDMRKRADQLSPALVCLEAWSPR